MALQKHIVSLPIDKGLDTKLDPKQEEVGYLRKAQNIVYETVKLLRKRNGYDLLDLMTTDGTVITDAIKLTHYKNELLILTNTKLYAYSESRQRLVEKGLLSSVSAIGHNVIKNANNQTQVDALTLQGFNVFVWKDSTGGVRYSVQDLVNNSFLVSNNLVSSTADRPVLAHIEGTVFVLYGESNVLKFKSFSILSPETLSSATTLASDRHTTLGLIDAESLSDRVVVAYNASNSGTDLSVLSIDSSGTPSSILQLASATATHALDVYVDTSSRVILTFSDNVNLKYAVLPSSLTSTIKAATVIEALAGVTTCCSIKTTSSNYTAYYEVNVTGTGKNYVRQASFTISGTITNKVNFKLGCGLGARTFEHAGIIYVTVVLDSEIQSSYFLLNASGQIITKFANQTAAGTIDYGVLQPIINIDDTHYMVPLIIHNRVQADNGTFFSTDGISNVDIDFDPVSKYSNAQLADALHICAGVLRLYDGSTVTEHGFHMFPEVIERVTNTVTGYVRTTVAGVAATTSEIQLLNFTAPATAGTFKLAFEGAKTTELTFSTTSAQLKTALEALSNITTVTVTGDMTSGFSITFDSPQRDVGLLTVEDSTLVSYHSYTQAVSVTPTTVTQGVIATTSEVQKINFSAVPESGYFTITIGAETTNKLFYNTNAAYIEAELEAFTAILTATVTGDFSLGFTMTIDTPQDNFTQCTIVTNTLAINKLTANSSSVSVTQTTITQGSGAIHEVQKLTFDKTPNFGHFKLSLDAETTPNIYYNSTPAEIKAMLEAFSAITTVTVVGDFTNGLTITLDAPLSNISNFVVSDNTLLNFTSNNMLDGSYAYLALYRWTDNNGRDHRSSPTLTPLTVVLAGGTNDQYASIKVQTLKITDKTNVVIELYRTEANGTVYYKVTDDLQPVLNVPTDDTVTITDTINDTTLISREPIYTTGGVLENISAPACFQITAYMGNRLVVAGEESNRVYFSKLISEGRPVEFTDGIYRDVDPVGGPITSIVNMVDKLLIFEEDACYHVTGDGPNNLGLQDSMNNPEILSTDIGCTSPESTIVTPGGLMFKSRKGIWIVTPGLSMEYIGARVEAYNADTVTSVAIVGELNQIRFTLSQDRTLVYNYQVGKWATFENHGALSSVVIGNDYYYLREDGVLYKENRTSFADVGSPIKMKIETGWLAMTASKLDGVSTTELQGYQRAFHALLLGSFKSAHKLRVKIAYDYNEAWVQEVLIDTADFIDAATYGSDLTYGDSSPYGGLGTALQARIDFKRQKCQAIKISIEDAQSVAGEGLSLSGISVRVGSKSGNNKLPNVQKYGTS